MKYKKTLLFLKLIVSIGILIYLANIISWDKLKALRLEAIYGILISLVINLLALVILSFRWSKLLNINMQSHSKNLFKIAYKGYLVGMFFNLFLPGSFGGDVFRIKYATDYVNISIKKSTFIIFSERLFGFMALLIVLAFGLFLNIGILLKIKVQINQLFAFMFVFLVFMVIAKYIIFKYITIDILNFILILLLSLLPHLGSVLIVAILAWSINSTITLSKLLFIVPLVQIATILPISLGGLGVREGVLAGLFTLFSVNNGVIISLMMFLVVVITGLFGLPFILKKFE